ncbi:MAG TPA: BON domain-containing protein [Burkholderiales bacterium]|jgi:hyperosmotically inducible protein|nr:BON domain-containing protein [Burkholderiales bacterium]
MNGFRTLIVTAAAGVVALGVAACDRPADRDRTSATTPPATSRAPATPAPATPPAPTADRSVGQTIDDAGITAKVKTALAAEKDVSATSINVDTVQGNVTLSGRVANQTEADRALQVARSVDGVKSVDSKLSLGS